MGLMQDPQTPSTPSKKKDDASATADDATNTPNSPENTPTAFSEDVGKPSTDVEPVTKPEVTSEPTDASAEEEKLLPAEATPDPIEPTDAPQTDNNMSVDAETEADSKVSGITDLPSLEEEEPSVLADANTTMDTPEPATSVSAPESPRSTASNNEKPTPVSVTVSMPNAQNAGKSDTAPAPSSPAQMAQSAFQPDNPAGVVGVAGGMVATKPKKSGAKKAALIIALLLILGGGAAAYWWWNKHKSTDTATTSGTSSDTTTTPDVCGTAIAAGGTAYTQTSGVVSKADQAYTANTADQSAVKVSGGALTLTNPTIVKSGDTSSSDNSSFVGQNAGVLATSGGKATITCGSIATTGTGANGAFAYGSGSSITLANVIIKASAQYAHGVMASGGGALTLSDVTISTSGANSAPIATDRGGGTVTVQGGTATSSGTDSPGLYSTGTITVSNASVTATGAEAAVIEGSNKIELTNTKLAGSKKSGVMILQSTSGDAQGSTGTFTMTSGSLTAAAGPLFYVTNATGNISLKGVTVTAPSGILLKAAADQWGTSGKNGGTATLTADSQTLNGNIVTDSISTATVVLKNNSSLNGSVNKAALTLDSTSAWSVSGDSMITTLSGASISGTSVSNITGNGHTVYYSNALNSALGGKTYDLAGGGKLMPQ